MGRRKGWATERTGRAPMRSPGRPGVNQRETKQAFWKCIATGASSEQAGASLRDVAASGSAMVPASWRDVTQSLKTSVGQVPLVHRT